MSTPPNDPGPTSAQRREAISRSHERQDIHGSEIAAAPLGTDTEAGREGPASADQRAHAEEMIRRHAPEVAAGKPDADR